MQLKISAGKHFFANTDITKMAVLTPILIPILMSVHSLSSVLAPLKQLKYCLAQVTYVYAK